MILKKKLQVYLKKKQHFFSFWNYDKQTAIKLHTQPGDQLICDHYSHIFNYEGGGVVLILVFHVK